MPVVATVDNVKIMFYPNEHPPPHFHAWYAEYRAVIDIDSLVVTEGFLPVAKVRAVRTWPQTRRPQFEKAFARALAHERVEPIR